MSNKIYQVLLETTDLYLSSVSTHQVCCVIDEQIVSLAFHPGFQKVPAVRSITRIIGSRIYMNPKLSHPSSQYDSEIPAKKGNVPFM